MGSLYTYYLETRWNYVKTYAGHIGGGGSGPVTRHNYTIDLEFGTQTSGQYIEGSFGFVLKANNGYRLPDNIVVKYGSSTLSIADYNYDKSTGLVTVNTAKTKKDITITGECVQLMSWAKFNAMTWEQVNDTYWSEINS